MAHANAVLAKDDFGDLVERTRLLEAIIGNFPGGIAVFDTNLRMVLCNEQQKRLLDYPDNLFTNGYPTLQEIFRFNARRGEYGPGVPETLVNARMDLARQQVAHTYERTRPNGTVLEIRGVPLDGGGFVTTTVDVTAQRQSQATVAHLAYHDPLTDLPNRILLQDRLEQAVARAKRGEQIAVHYFDLDRFKEVNDRLGHAVGDMLLQAVAGRLKTITRQTDTVARIGGDEFVLIQSALVEESNASALARRVIDLVSNSYDVDDRRITIGASVGIAIAPRHGTDATMLLRKADAALYRCKADGRGTFAFFD